MPTPSGLHAEHILYDLMRDPRAFLSPYLTKCLTQLQRHRVCCTACTCASRRRRAFCHTRGTLQTPNSARFSRCSAYFVCGDGAPHARTRDRRSRTGEWAAINALWAQHSHGLPLHLLAALDALAADAHARFSLIPPPPLSSHAPLGCLLAGTNKLLQVLSHLISSHPFTPTPNPCCEWAR